MATQTETSISLPVSTIDVSYIPRGSVTAEIMFSDAPEDGSQAFTYPDEPPEGLPQRNFRSANMEMLIHDIRGQESLYNIDENAFEPLKTGPSVDVDFTSKESVLEKYYPEIERILQKRLPEAKRIVPFSYTIRPSSGNPPLLHAHIDQSPKAAASQVHAFLTDEAEELLKGRVRIINVWRPLNGPVLRNPLAYADSKTVSDDELLRVDYRSEGRVDESFFVKHADSQQWHYWSGMENDERLLLVCYDSEKGVRVAHAAFVDPRTPEGAPPRESVEVRAFVFG